MNEEQIKFLCKWLIENSSRPLTDLEKEALKLVAPAMVGLIIVGLPCHAMHSGIW